MSSKSTLPSSAMITDLATAFENHHHHQQQPKATPQQQQQQNVTPLMMYQTGLILYNLKQQQKEEQTLSNEKQNLYKNVIKSYQDLIQSLSPTYVTRVICKEINLAFCTIMEEEEEEEEEEDNNMEEKGEKKKEEALKALFGIYSYSPLLCSLGFDDKVCLNLVNYYNDESLSKKKKKKKSLENDKNECIFITLSMLLQHGLIYPQSNTKEKEEEEEDVGLSRVMEVVQILTAGSDGSNFCLGDLLLWQDKYNKIDDEFEITSLPKAIKSVFVNPSDQREYLLLMLNSCSNSSTTKTVETSSSSSSSSSKKKHPVPPSNNKKKKQSKNQKASAAAKTTLQNYISQIKSVLPTLGEGYIEVALSIYNHDVQTTISSLIESQSNPHALHPRLRALDPSLPARKKDNLEDINEDEEEEAKLIQKAHLQKMESDAEQTSYMIEQTALAFSSPLAEEENEYNDDYDDQYDAHEQDGGEIGNTDGGMYDVDLDAIRAYNKATLEAEREASFWEENRNLNRQSGKKGKGKGNKNKSNDDEENINDNRDDEQNEVDGEGQEQKKYRGPDKGKGGRIIGPDGKYVPFKKGGKKGRAQQQKQQQEQGGGKASGGGGGRGGGGQNQGKKKGKQGGAGGAGGAASSTSAAAAKSGGGGADGSSNMTKIQKRRKNDNKSKIGNHHRKERALKKAGGPGGI